MFPPAVQSKSSPIFTSIIVANHFTTAELHDEKNQPDIKGGSNIGMPLDKFIEEAYEGLAAGKEEVTVGDATTWYEKIEVPRQNEFHGLVKVMNKIMGSH